jgi:hypothetical protein
MSNTTTLASPSTEASEPRFADRDEREATIASDLMGALDEPGF